MLPPGRQDVPVAPEGDPSPGDQDGVGELSALQQVRHGPSQGERAERAREGLGEIRCRGREGALIRPRPKDLDVAPEIRRKQTKNHCYFPNHTHTDTHTDICLLLSAPRIFTHF